MTTTRFASMFAICAAMITLFAWSTSAQAALFDSNDILVGEFNAGRISVYDENFVFKTVLATGAGEITGLDFTPTGNVVTLNRSSRVREYDPDGNLVQSFPDSTSNPFDIKTGADGRIYTGNQAGIVREFTSAGAATGRTFGAADNFGSVAVLPGKKLWISGAAVGHIRVFDLVTGAQTGTLPWSGGENTADSMRYSVETNTVLLTDADNGTVWERDLAGNLLRTFTPAPFAPAINGGVARGPNNEVWLSSFEGNSLLRWDAAGNYLGNTPLSEGGGTFSVLWTGAAHVVPEPGALMLACFSGLFGAALWRRQIGCKAAQ